MNSCQNQNDESSVMSVLCTIYVLQTNRYHINRTFVTVSSVVCIKRDDNYVSAGIEYEGGWEMNEVNKVMHAMDLYPEASFIGRWPKCLSHPRIIQTISDAGSNIGVFTLAVANMRRRVLAVDMMSDNLAFIRESLKLSDKTDFVELINNGIRSPFFILLSHLSLLFYMFSF